LRVATGGGYDVERVRRDFPILARTVHGKPLTYLDSAASSQRPLAVIRAVDDYESRSHANVHRGVHALSQEATAAFEGARERVRRFINARSTREIIFTRGTTESINLVAQSWGRSRLGPGDEILITALEHHANIVPWQMVRDATGCSLVVAPIDRSGELIMEAFHRLLTPRTRIVAVAHVSNALGTILPVAEIIAAAHARGVPVLVDGAQAIPHTRVDVQALGADFYAFSGHKLYGPTGIGVLYGREELLSYMPPWQGASANLSAASFLAADSSPASCPTSAASDASSSARPAIRSSSPSSSASRVLACLAHASTDAKPPADGPARRELPVPAGSPRVAPPAESPALAGAGGSAPYIRIRRPSVARRSCTAASRSGSASTDCA
jgi:selenocysteine lyase/cysteine desulfurase